MYLTGSYFITTSANKIMFVYPLINLSSKNTKNVPNYL